MLNYIEMSPKPNLIGVMSKISLNLYSIKLSNSYNGTSAKHKVSCIDPGISYTVKVLLQFFCDTELPLVSFPTSISHVT